MCSLQSQSPTHHLTANYSRLAFKHLIRATDSTPPYIQCNEKKFLSPQCVCVCSGVAPGHLGEVDRVSIDPAGTLKVMAKFTQNIPNSQSNPISGGFVAFLTNSMTLYYPQSTNNQSKLSSLGYGASLAKNRPPVFP